MCEAISLVAKDDAVWLFQAPQCLVKQFVEQVGSDVVKLSLQGVLLLNSKVVDDDKDDLSSGDNNSDR